MKIINPYRFGGAADSLLTDLVAWWSLDETSGTRINNHNPGTHDLTDTNTVGSATGVVGNAAVFVNANLETLSTAHHADLVMGDNPFTIAGWMYRTASTDSGAVVLLKGADITGVTMEWTVLTFPSSSQNALFRVRNAANSADISTANVAAAHNTWFFFIAAHDPDSNIISFELNRGTPVTAAVVGGTYAGGTGIMVFGAQAVGGSARNLDGMEDEFAIWRRLLTTDEKDRLYNSGNGMAYPG